MAPRSPLVRRLLHLIAAFLAGVAPIVIRALFMIFNGIIMGVVFCGVPVLGLAAMFGTVLQVIFNHVHIELNGLAVTYFVLLSALEITVLFMMFLGRYLI